MRRSWLLCLLLLATTACTHVSTTVAPNATATAAALQLDLRPYALPLTTTDPTAPFSDLAPLKASIGTASIVGLGEGTHGSSEFFTMKDRLVRSLVEQKGFTMVGLEVSWSVGENANDYVLNGIGNAKDSALQMGWPWNTHEVEAVLQWMHDYNKTHTPKVVFAGFDCQA
ncbi:MAG: erythromycin esterase family protein [Ktedonobacterales bacterium]|nr:erythromycin esterase family protein [Ktedonobacterales bacterium]